MAPTRSRPTRARSSWARRRRAKVRGSFARPASSASVESRKLAAFSPGPGTVRRSPRQDRKDHHTERGFVPFSPIDDSAAPYTSGTQPLETAAKPLSPRVGVDSDPQDLGVDRV